MDGVRDIGRKQKRTAEPAHDRAVPASVPVPRQHRARAGGAQPPLYVVDGYVPRDRLVTERT